MNVGTTTPPDTNCTLGCDSFFQAVLRTNLYIGKRRMPGSTSWHFTMIKFMLTIGIAECLCRIVVILWLQYKIEKWIKSDEEFKKH